MPGKSDSSLGKGHISLDYNFMMAPFIGSEHGLTDAEIVASWPLLESAYKGVDIKYQSGELTWIDLPKSAEVAEEINRCALDIRAKFDNFVVLGIGGSALGAIALHTALIHPYYNLLPDNERGGPRLFVLDNVDPFQMGSFLDIIDISRTCFNVISKSGGTAETMAQFILFQRKLRSLGGDDYADQIIVTTSATKGLLRKVAIEEGYRTFAIPEGVGGRFSVLSPVGLLSAAVTGADIKALLDGGSAALERCFDNSNLQTNIAAVNALLQFLAFRRGKRISVMMPYSYQLKDVADWYRQLWAESLGKARDNSGKYVNIGPTPVKALGVTDQHSQVQLYIEGPYDKVITFIRVKEFEKITPIPQGPFEKDGIGYLGGHSFAELIDAEAEATALALAEAKRMNATLFLPEISAYTIGQLLMILELQTAYSGELYEINAFDQPGVEAGKINTYALMGRPGYEDRKHQIERAISKKSDRYIVR